MSGRFSLPAGTFPSRDLVGHHQGLLDPDDRRRLVAPPALVVGQGLPLVALREGGIVVQGRLRAPALGGHPVHQDRGDPRQPLEGGGLRRDVGHRAGRPLRLRCGEERLIVKGVEAVAQRIGRGELPAPEAAEPAIGLEHRAVVETIPARGEQEDHRLDLLALAVAALALPDLHVLGDRVVQPQGAQGLQDQGQPGAARHRVRARDHFHRVREESLAHRAARRGSARPPGGVPCRRARFTAVSSLTRAQSSS